LGVVSGTSSVPLKKSSCDTLLDSTYQTLEGV